MTTDNALSQNGFFLDFSQNFVGLKRRPKLKSNPKKSWVKRKTDRNMYSAQIYSEDIDLSSIIVDLAPINNLYAKLKGNFENLGPFCLKIRLGFFLKKIY